MDFLKLNYRLTFAKKPYAKDIIEKSVNLFITIEKINYEYQLALFLALKMMIKYHFEDDMEKTRELLTMITQSVSETMIEDVPFYKKTQKRLEDAQNEIKIKDIELAEKDNELAEKLSEKNKEIESLKAEIESLKNNNI